MQKRRMGAGLSAAICFLLLASLGTSAQAGRIIYPGSPNFRPAFLRADGPQPFSTRRSRELQAARSQNAVGGLFVTPIPQWSASPTLNRSPLSPRRGFFLRSR